MPQLPPLPPADAPALPLPEPATAPAPCEAVTRQGLQDLVDAISAAQLKAEANVAANGEGVPGAEYAVAATHARDFVVEAHEHVAKVVATADKYDVPPGLNRYPAISYQIYLACRQAINYLHAARHWEAISAVYNRDREKVAAALACIGPITAAIELAEPLSADATGCYVAVYAPS
jgi:hypothetical protein